MNCPHNIPIRRFLVFHAPDQSAGQSGPRSSSDLRAIHTNVLPSAEHVRRSGGHPHAGARNNTDGNKKWMLRLKDQLMWFPDTFGGLWHCEQLFESTLQTGASVVESKMIWIFLTCSMKQQHSPCLACCCKVRSRDAKQRGLIVPLQDTKYIFMELQPESHA
jgi:hypothetical protein